MSIHDYPSIFSRLWGLTAAQRAEVFYHAERQWCWHCGGPQGACECGWPTDGTDADSGCEGGRHWREWADEIAIDADGEVCAYEGGAYWTGVEWVPMDDFDGLRFETIATVGPIPIAFARQLQFRLSRHPAADRAASLASPNRKEEP